MKLHNGDLFWPATLEQQDINLNDIDLPSDRDYDVIITGGGMSGALCAYTLVKAGLKVAIVEKRTVAAGSSSANTGLLQFSNDIMLHELIEQIGESQAVRFYKLCLEAVDHLEEVARSLPIDTHFIRRKSICFASSEEHASKLQKEYEVLKQYGFPVNFWTKKDMEKHLPFTRQAALITEKDAEVNPYRFVMGIVRYLLQQGAEIFEHTEVEEISEEDAGVTLQTSRGSLTASYVIFCTGYEAPATGENIGASINRSYAIATDPIENLASWWERALIWETNRPYFYMRTTSDNRIIAGGLDEDPPEAPGSQEIIQEHGEKIAEELRKLFPDLTISVSHAWCATFGESIDNLPFIGRDPDKKNTFHLRGYGGNGTVYSMLGSLILRDLITGTPNPDAEIVKLDRKNETAG